MTLKKVKIAIARKIEKTKKKILTQRPKKNHRRVKKNKKINIYEQKYGDRNKVHKPATSDQQ